MLNNHSSTSPSVISAYWPIHGNVITAFAQGQLCFILTKWSQ